MIQRTQRLTRDIRRAAFTLMEILVVVAIIVIIAGLGSYYVIGQLEQSKLTSIRIECKEIERALENYMVDHGVYPQNLSALLVVSELGKGPYLKSRDGILDPWDREYTLDTNGQRGLAAGNTVPVPDVFTVVEGRGEIGNFTRK